jgi:hypothetical protein
MSFGDPPEFFTKRCAIMLDALQAALFAFALALG